MAIFPLAIFFIVFGGVHRQTDVFAIHSDEKTGLYLHTSRFFLRNKSCDNYPNLPRSPDNEPSKSAGLKDGLLGTSPSGVALSTT